MNEGIYTMKPDGSDVQKVIGEGGAGHSWSPDGKMIAFTSNRDGNHLDLYVINADGSGIRRLTNSAEEKVWPSWSPARKP
jgi:TolB protein